MGLTIIINKSWVLNSIFYTVAGNTHNTESDCVWVSVRSRVFLSVHMCNIPHAVCIIQPYGLIIIVYTVIYNSPTIKVSKIHKHTKYTRILCTYV